MPHHIFGLGWDEIASIISIFTVVFGGFIGLNESIEKLSNVIDSLKFQLTNHQKSIDDVSSKMDRINDHVVDHEARLKVLEKEEDDNRE